MNAELWVYGDESSIGPRDRYAALAGFIASAKQWRRFSNDWALVLKSEGITEFHSAHFFARKWAKKSGSNPYRDWSEAQADSFLDALLNVLRTHRTRVRPLNAVLDTRAFFDYSWGERNFLTGASWNNETKKFVTSGAPQRTYHLPFFVLIGLALYEAKPQDCKVHFRMDEQGVVERGVQLLFNRSRTMANIPAELRTKLGDLHPGRSEDHEGIQAADLLAHVSATTYAKQETLSRDRLRALRGLMEIWGSSLDPGIIGSRAMAQILEANLSPEDQVLVRKFPTPQERQPLKSKQMGRPESATWV